MVRQRRDCAVRTRPASRRVAPRRGAIAVALQLPLGPTPIWVHVERCHPDARALADRHYSRQTVGAGEFMPPGQTFVMLTVCRRAVWGVVHNLDPAGAKRWRCSIFRNEGAGLSSDLIRAATAATFAYWLGGHGLPAAALTTEIDPGQVRAKRDPGRCFRRAGWLDRGTVRGLVVLEAPSVDRSEAHPSGVR